ncbi:MAG: ATP-binding protein, partial [Bernardetiaceae bacterium]|nr:ATP-binding protein [Bernardetiaceae bacterium]
MEKLEIENFAGIPSMTLEFKDINILIGPQGAGKSITVKLLYFFKGFFEALLDSSAQGKLLKNINKERAERFIGLFPRKYWPQSDFRIKYTSGNGWQEIISHKNKLSYTCADSWLQIAEIIFLNQRSSLSERLSDYFMEIGEKVPPPTWLGFLKLHDQDIIHSVISNTAFEQIFIPAGRSFFSTLANNIFYLIKQRTTIDPYLVDFGEVYEEMRDLYFNDDTVSVDGLENLTEPILNSKIIQENNIEFFLHADGRKVGLADASSGQQEALPIIIILKTLAAYMHRLPENGVTLYIEEPEAHLFPSAQKNITQMLARVFNQLYPRLQIFITTHSPYLLASFNNLLEAGHLAATKPEIVPTLANIVPQAEQLAPGTVCAYHLAQGQA